MIKTILAPLGGGDTDQAVLGAALLVAQPFQAHIECFHNFLDPALAAACLPQVSYLYGAALRSAMEQLAQRGEARVAAALHHYAEFCRLNGLPTDGSARSPQGVSASMLQGSGAPVDNLVFHARHNDLVVMARPQPGDGVPGDLLARIVLQGGQPVLLVPPQAPQRLLGTVMVCWKDSAEAARALVLALPLLRQARKVVLVAVEEANGAAQASLQAAQAHLGWHGIDAAAKCVGSGSCSIMDTLWSAAVECGADLLVMGGYSRGPTRELLFGGCTQAALAGGELPVLIAH
ncbi:MAG: universal stress protein [Nevskia sp.]|nr:universal stress protein [Nevskia sp.]